MFGHLPSEEESANMERMNESLQYSHYVMVYLLAPKAAQIFFKENSKYLGYVAWMRAHRLDVEPCFQPSRKKNRLPGRKHAPVVFKVLLSSVYVHSCWFCDYPDAPLLLSN